jgi:hypothetical protein
MSRSYTSSPTKRLAVCSGTAFALLTKSYVYLPQFISDLNRYRDKGVGMHRACTTLRIDDNSYVCEDLKE